MANSPTLNHLLRALLDEAGWSGAELARQVNAVAAETGLTPAYDRKTVSFWLAGRRPRPPAPAIVAEAFSRVLAREVQVADTGLIRGSRADDQPGPHDAVAALDELLRLQRRGAAMSGAYSLALLDVPSWTQAEGVPPAPDLPPAAVSAPHVESLEQMARLFTDTDDAFGVGYARATAAAYLAHDVAPLLRAPAPPSLRVQLFRAATKVIYRCAFMCYDDEQHALAQRYYRFALHTAKESADPVGYAVTLRAMSVQARSLGHYRNARDLAEAAAGQRTASSTQDAFLLGQLAVAEAASANRTAAISALSATERRLSQLTSGGGRKPHLPAHAAEVMGDYDAAAFAYQEATVRALLRDHMGAITALQVSLRERPSGERRSRAVVTARLAELQLRTGQLERAAHTWHAFLDEYPHLSSERITAALRSMKAQLRPFSGNVRVQHLIARSAAL